jgi:hypothetical protein
MANYNVPSVPNTGGLPLMQFQNGGYGALGTSFALPTENWDTNYQYMGALTRTHGSHTLKFGANLLRRDWSTFQHLFLANFNENSTQTNSTGTAAGTGGNSIASLLTGYCNSTNRTLSLIAPQYRDWEIGEYIQDNWRISSKLTSTSACATTSTRRLPRRTITLQTSIPRTPPYWRLAKSRWQA